MDLRKVFPRSPRVKLAGYVHLGRMYDKCRAWLAGTQGEYIYPCPMDTLLLDFTGITSHQFTEMVTNRNEEEFLALFSKKARTHRQEDIDQWNEGLLTREPDTDEKRAFFKECLEKIDSSRTDITCWSDLLDLEEGRPVPLRNQGG